MRVAYWIDRPQLIDHLSVIGTLCSITQRYLRVPQLGFGGFRRALHLTRTCRILYYFLPAATLVIKTVLECFSNIPKAEME